MKNIALILTILLASCASNGATQPATGGTAMAVTTVNASSCKNNLDCLSGLQAYCAKQQEYEASPATEVFHKGRLAYFLSLAGTKTAPAPAFEVACNEP
jgi:hypothetical protein